MAITGDGARVDVSRSGSAGGLTFVCLLMCTRVHSGYSGVAYYGGWLASPWYQIATTATVWVSTCGTYSTASGANTLDVNGRPSSLAGDMAGLAVPDQLTINGNTQVDAQWSAFGVAEFLTWNRKITPTELREVQAYLTTKYGLKLNTPPAPPTPAAAMPPLQPLAQSLESGMMAWCVCAVFFGVVLRHTTYLSCTRTHDGQHNDAGAPRSQCHFATPCSETGR